MSQHRTAKMTDFLRSTTLSLPYTLRRCVECTQWAFTDVYGCLCACVLACRLPVLLGGVTGRKKGSSWKRLYLGFMSLLLSYSKSNQPSAKVVPIFQLLPQEYIAITGEKLRCHPRKKQSFAEFPNPTHT